MNFNILFFTDPHNSDTPPRMRNDGYRDEILAKQEFLIKPAKQVDLVIIGGDIFHQKKAHKVSYYLVNRLMEIYREYGTTIIVPGNHDFDMSPEEIQYNPLGVISRLPNVSVLHGESLNGYKGVDIFCKGLGDDSPAESGTSLMKALRMWKENQSVIQKHRSVTPFSIAVIHDSVSTKKFPFDVTPFVAIEKYADLFFFGHVHKWQEFRGKIVAPGALSRGVLDIDSIDRDVLFAVVSVDADHMAHEMKGYKIPVKPSEEVFRTREYVANKRIEEGVIRFIENLSRITKNGLESLDVEAAISMIEHYDISEKVKEKAIEVLRLL